MFFRRDLEALTIDGQIGRNALCWIGWVASFLKLSHNKFAATPEMLQVGPGDLQRAIERQSALVAPETFKQ